MKYSVIVLLCALLTPSVCRAQDALIVTIEQDDRTSWIGTAASVNDETELCAVRREYYDHPVFQRDLHRGPFTAKFASDGLSVELQSPGSHPSTARQSIKLSPNEDAAATTWIFTDPNWVQTDDSPDSAERSGRAKGNAGLIREMGVQRHGDEPASLVEISFADLNHVAYYRNRKDAENADASAYPMSDYDKLDRIGARKLEKRLNMADLITPGIILVVMDSRQIAAVSEKLDQLGDGARILNRELAACPGARMTFVVTVPPGLEYWYARQLQTTGLVASAYPEVQALDPAFSEPFLFSRPTLTPLIKDRARPLASKYADVWRAFQGALMQFAQTRRPGFSTSGGIVRLASPNNMFRAEITGRSLAMCQTRRWEKLVVQAVINSVDQSTGKAVITINFSDGFFGNGTSRPSDIRFRDNRMPDGDLGRLQEIFLGANKSGTSIPAGIRCTQ